MNYLTGLVTTLWPYLLAAVLLTAYFAAARRYPRVPRIPLFWFLVFVWGHIGVSVLAHPRLFPDILKWSETALVVALSWGVVRLIFYAIVERRRAGDPRPPLARLTRDVFLSALYAATALVLLRVHGSANLAGILTTSAVLTAVIGLAMQTTLSNLFAGLAIQLERPFGIGDWISVGGLEGRVISISWKSTRLLNRERHMVYLPNSMVTTGAFRVFTRPDPTYIAKHYIGLDYNAPPDRVIEVLLSVLKTLQGTAADPAPEVRLKSFGDFAILYEMRFSLTDASRENRIAADLNRALWYALRRAGLQVPFPIRDVRLAHEERRRAAEDRAADLERITVQLRALPLFTALADPDIERLAREAPCVVYGAGEAVIRRGEAGSSLFVVLSGRCEVWSGAPGTTERIAEIPEGECFGEMSLLTGEPRSATVTAAADTCLLEVGKDLFAGVLRANPGVAERLAERLERRRAASAGAGRAASANAAADAGLLQRIRRFFRM